MMHERTNEKETRSRMSNPRLRQETIGILSDPIESCCFSSESGLRISIGSILGKNPLDPTDGLRRFPSAGNYRILLLHPTASASRIKKFRFLVRIRISFGFLQESTSTEIGSFILRKISFRFSEMKNPKLHFSYRYEDFVLDFKS